MKAYIVTSGSYSDYGIEAVFLQKEAAEAYANRYNEDRNLEEHSYDWARVEEYEVVDGVEQVRKQVRTNWPQGSVPSPHLKGGAIGGTGA